MACLNCKNENRLKRCATASRKGHLRCLMWAREKNCPWDWRTCALAARYGHLQCLKWAREHGCPWNEDTCSWAACNGDLNCLIWARENECPWDKWTCVYATKYGHEEILEWIHKNGSLCNCIEKEMYIEWSGWKEGEECNICLEVLDESTVKFRECRHHYHKECMDTMLEMRRKEGRKGCSICKRGK